MRFTIRDLLWLMVVVGLAVGWSLERQHLISRADSHISSLASRWANEAGHVVRYTAMDGTEWRTAGYVP